MQINNINASKQNINISTDNVKLNLKKNEFIENSIITVKIVDIKSDEITVKTNLGELIKAKPLNIKGLKVSDLAKFLVKHEDGNLILKFQTPINLKNKALTDILKNNFLDITDSNIKLIKSLIENNLPIETYTKLNQIQKAIGSEDIEKAMFFLENEIKPTKENIKMLDDFKNGEMKISSQLESLVETIDKTNDKDIKNIVTKILIEGESALKSINIIDNLKVNNNEKSNIGFDNKNLPIENFKDLAKELIEIFPQKKELINTSLQNKNDYIKAIDNLPENIKNEIKDLIKEHEKQINNNNKEFMKPDVSIEEKLEFILKKTDDFPLSEFDLKENSIKFLADKILPHFKIEISTEDYLDLKDQLKEKLKFDYIKSSSSDADDFLEKLKENVETAKKFLTNETKEEVTKDLIKILDKIQKNLDFTSNLKNALLVQLPINLNNNNINSEIFVFKDKTKKKSKTEKTSALIALDTLNLGRFETYIQKNDRNITCQFRLKDKEVEKLVKANLEKLNNKLKHLNYSINNIYFKTLEEDFTILNKEPVLEDPPKNKNSCDKVMFFDTTL